MASSHRPLAVNGCEAACSWGPTGDALAGEPLFRCAGCGSEWVPSEPWTPADADGSVALSVDRVRRS